jgi:hypothetical protein
MFRKRFSKVYDLASNEKEGEIDMNKLDKNIRRKICIFGVLGILLILVLSKPIASVTINPTNITMADTEWIGLGAAKGRIIFDDEATDEIEITESKLGIGTASPDRLLHVELDDATTNDVSYPLRLTHTTSGTPADDIGVGIEFEVEDASGNTVCAAIEGKLTDVTNGAEEGALWFYTTDIGGGGFSAKMVLDKDGNLGVGTGDPQGKLHIREITSETTYGIYAVHSAAITGTGYGVFVVKSGASTTNVGGLFSASGATNNYGLLVTDGYVGIGTSGPSRALEINSAGTGDNLRLIYNDNDGGPASGYVDFDTDSSGNLQIQSSGTGVNIGTTTPIATLDVDGGLATNIITKDHNNDGYTPSGSDYTILVDAGSATDHIDIDLPAASSRTGQILVIKRIDDTTSGYDIRINRAGSDLIDGSTQKTLDTQWESLMIQSNGSNWYIIANQP